MNNRPATIVTTKLNVVYRNRYIELQDNEVLFAGHKVGKHIRIIENESVTPGCVVICVNGKGELLVIDIYRYGIQRRSIEFPRGYKNPDETMEEAAIRELEEETNIVTHDKKNAALLGSFFVNTANNASEIGIVRIQAEASPDMRTALDEGIAAYKWLTVSDIGERIRKGEIMDSFTVNAFALFCLTPSQGGLLAK